MVGADAGDFTFTTEGDTLAGELSFAAVPDYEIPADSNRDNTYSITVQALDSEGRTGRITVTVAVRDDDEPPVIMGPDSVSIEEGSTNLVVGTYTATDQEGDNIAWQVLDGADANRFRLTSTASNGTLSLRAIPNFESPTDSGKNNIYNVSPAVRAGNHTVRQAVVVTVTNKEEPGMLTLPITRPQAEADYTATLSDPDGVQSTDWTWERSMSRSGSLGARHRGHPRQHRDERSTRRSRAMSATTCG